MQENNLEQKYPELKPKWQKRFHFFDTYGTNPSAPEYKAPLKKLGFGDRGVINFNFIAFFFGFIYFFVLGLWRKNLVLMGANIAVGFIFALVFVDLPERTFDMIVRFIGFAFAAIYATTVNRAYYLHKVKGSK